MSALPPGGAGASSGASSSASERHDPARFGGRVVLVAGGTGGLGAAVARAFLAEGARVVVTYRQAAEYEALRAEFGSGAAADASRARLDGRRVDVTDEAQALALLQAIAAEHGPLDALVNAVGGYAGGAPLWELDGAAFERLLALNLRAAYVLARAAMPAMTARGRGVWINVAAKAGVEPTRGAAVYSASKAAVLALADALAAEVAGTGVRVNSVLPSIIDTPANRRAMPDADPAGWPKPDEIARVILFLCSDDARVVHGAALPVYGTR